MPPRETPRSQLPTIGHYRVEHGLTGIVVCCLGTFCPQSGRMTFDALALPDDTVFIDIPKLKRFRCPKCQSTRVEVRAAWGNRLKRRP